MDKAVEAAIREVDRFVYKPPAEELPSVEGHKNALMRAVLEAAAPHMLPTPEGVSEAEKTAIQRLPSQLDRLKREAKWILENAPEASRASIFDAANTVYVDAHTLLSALSSERERAEELKVKLEDALHDYGNADSEAKGAELDVRDAEARADQAEFLLALALECARTKAAREAAMFDLADAAEARAQAAERERDEARRGERNLSEHARKVAHEANKAFGVVEDMEEFWDACGHPSNRGHLTPAEQVSSIIRERDATEARAEAAEAKVKEAEEIIAPFAKAGTLVGPRVEHGDFWAYLPAAGPEFGITGDHLRVALRWTEEASQGEGE